ncbi:uncharacterized protein LOC111831721 [Capsella rubella]|uniref:uncharacterized protein LOC111831721 n=1 Tax=Capsella rubella TaxID=81985 RepID=UPI000CD5AB68|nr:uncharacterized protein LOC111831721 [Capsella rubella]
MRPVIAQYFRRIGYGRQSRDLSSLNLRPINGSTAHDRALFAAIVKGHLLDIVVGGTCGYSLAALMMNLLIGNRSKEAERIEQEWKQKQLELDECEKTAEKEKMIFQDRYQRKRQAR